MVADHQGARNQGAMIGPAHLVMEWLGRAVANHRRNPSGAPRPDSAASRPPEKGVASSRAMTCGTMKSEGPMNLRRNFLFAATLAGVAVTPALGQAPAPA